MSSQDSSRETVRKRVDANIRAAEIPRVNQIGLGLSARGGQARDRIKIDALTDAYCFVVTAWFGAPGVVLPRFLLSPKVLTVPLATIPVVLPVMVLFARRTVVPATCAEIAVLLHVK